MILPTEWAEALEAAEIGARGAWNKCGRPRNAVFGLEDLIQEAQMAVLAEGSSFRRIPGAEVAPWARLKGYRAAIDLVRGAWGRHHRRPLVVREPFEEDLPFDEEPEYDVKEFLQVCLEGLLQWLPPSKSAQAIRLWAENADMSRRQAAEACGITESSFSATFGACRNRYLRSSQGKQCKEVA